jgi:transposase
MTDWRSGKRRQYTLELKKQVLSEAAVPGTSVALVARRHGLNANLIFNWRRRFGGNLVPAFASVVVGPVLSAPSGSAAAPSASSSRMEVVCHGGRRIELGPDFDASALDRLLAVVEGR